MAYQRPMVTVDQNMTITPTSIERDQPAFIFGPNYELHRYSDPDEKLKIGLDRFYSSLYNSSHPMVRKFPGAIDDDAVDRPYTKLTGDNVVIKLWDVVDATTNIIVTFPEANFSKARAINGGFTIIGFSGKKYSEVLTDGSYRVGNLSDGLPRGIARGDYFRISYNVTGDTISGDNVTPPTVVYTEVLKSVYSEEGGYDIDRDSSSDGPIGTYVTIEDAIPDDIIPSTVDIKLVDFADKVEFTRKNIAEYKANPNHTNGEYQWETPDEKQSVDGSTSTYYVVKVNELYTEVEGFFSTPTYCQVLEADLYVTFRELISSYTDTLHSLTGASEVANMLGTVDPDNPLAMGVYMAALNASTDDGDEAPPVFFMATPSDGKGGLDWDAVLNRASLTDRPYVFVPVTQDDTVIDKVQNHVLEMSTKTVKMWRIAAASKPVPDLTCKLNRLMDPQGDEYLAIPLTEDGMAPNQSATEHGPYYMLRVVKAFDNSTGNPDTQFRSTVVPGDIIRWHYHDDAWGEPTYDEYIVKRVLNNYTLEIDLENSNDSEGINVAGLGIEEGALYYKPLKIEVWHRLTAAESAEEISKVSKAMASRRMLNVYPSLFKNDGVELTGEFAACAVAGLISATEPQQPITNVTVRGIDDIPVVYQTFNNTQLDLIASGGTFIVMQDLPNDRVYVRHQITTAYPDGNLNTAELSITKNVDSISYAFAEVFRPYYGRYNITPDLLVTFRNLASQLIDQFGGVDSVYGPQLIVEQTEIRYVRQNELMKDHVDIGITLGVPYPCNNIDIVLTV